MNKLTAADTKKRQVFTAQAKLAVKYAASAAAAGTTPGADDPEAGEWGATLTGYALVWNVFSQDRGGYKVKLAPNSAQFEDVVFALWHHDYSKPIGTTTNGTLRLTPDEYGVKVEIDLPNTSAGRDAAELVGDGYVAGMSFAMSEVLEFVENNEGDETTITFTSYKVDEVTVTAIPAFTDTSIEVKGGEDEGDEDGYAKEIADESARFEQARLALYAI